MKDKFFETASFHIVKPCNMSCKFCYATFQDMKGVRQLHKSDVKTILDKLKRAGLQKVTLAGGEPMLYKHLDNCINYAKDIGLTTSIITNGSLITGGWLDKMKYTLDWIGISIDSIDDKTLTKIGRTTTKKFPFYWYVDLINAIKERKFKLKINTVVNTYNYNEDLNEFISWAQPDRWKVFQALKVEGQNDKQWDEIKVTDDQFNKFIERHSKQKSLVPENNEYMRGSYLLIDPQGRLFENSLGKHTYSRSLVDNNIEDCLSDIQLNREMFEKRGGIYAW